MAKQSAHGEEDHQQGTGLRGVMMQGLSRSLISLVIKIATAGLTYLMFVALSRVMDMAQYGLFAFGFALATMLAIGASFGQQTAILRFWPEYEAKGNLAGAKRALEAGWGLTLIAGVGIALVLCVGAWVWSLTGSADLGVNHIYAAALLVVPLGVAEYASSALRAQGSVLTGLLPRDIVWRLSFPLIVIVLAYQGQAISGSAALVLAALVLTLAMGGQFAMARRLGYYNRISLAPVRPYWAEHGRASLWFFAGTVIDSAALNLDIVLVGLFVNASEAGVYFNAFRTAGLMTLFMFAITLVIAPMVARHYHEGDLQKAQGVTTLCAWAGFVFSVAVFVIYVFFGDLVLSLFGPEFSAGHLALIILSVGLLADAATGPTRIVMMMTGHERQYVTLFGAIMGLGFVVQLVAIPLFGIVGAAIVNAGSRVIAQTVIAVWTTRRVGIDTSLLGVTRLLGGQN